MMTESRKSVSIVHSSVERIPERGGGRVVDMSGGATKKKKTTKSIA